MESVKRPDQPGHTWVDPWSGEFCAAYGEHGDNPPATLQWDEAQGAWLDADDTASTLEILRLARESRDRLEEIERLRAAISAAAESLPPEGS